MDKKELTFRAVLTGAIISVILGAANAYLGLKAGMTIAATYPAAVISMAVLRTLKGNLLEENIARTLGSIGESVAAGAIFTLPSFVIAGIWEPFFTPGHYVISSLIMITGGTLGIAFIALIRKTMVEDPSLPYPESIAAAEIHKTGSNAPGRSRYLFGGMIAGATIKLAGEIKLFPVYLEKFILFSRQMIGGINFSGKGGFVAGSPGISPAYLGVGFIIGPRLGALNFSGTLLAWGALIPMFLFFLSPHLPIDTVIASLLTANPSMSYAEASQQAWLDTAYQVWKLIVRPMAIGGMIVSALFTLYRMRHNLQQALQRSFAQVKSSVSSVHPSDQDLRFPYILVLLVLCGGIIFFLSCFIFHMKAWVALLLVVVLLLLSFFLSAIAGYLVGVIGSSNNPISGLTLTAIVITALLFTLLGVGGAKGMTALLVMAAIVCTGAAVAGEMLQDLKAGHLLKGTPVKMQVSDLLGVVLSGAVLFAVLALLHQGDVSRGIHEGYRGGFGSKSLPAPQASMMAMLAGGIMQGQMPWLIIIAGMLMGKAFIAMKVSSPMLVFIGMYLPIETTFAIFAGGLIKGIADYLIQRTKTDKKEKEWAENTGVLLASGLIAGEALMGLLIAVLAGGDIFLSRWITVFKHPPLIMGMAVLLFIAFILIYFPCRRQHKI